MTVVLDPQQRWAAPAAGAESPWLTRTQYVDQRLRAAILGGELAPGERLRPNELASRFQVSPTPLREALLRLEAAGLVETVPHRGTRVTPLTRTALHELYELRVLLEPLALRKSLAHPERVDLAALRGLHARLTEVVDGGELADVLLLEQVHRGFHRAMLAGCDSAWLLSLVDNLADHSSRYRLLSFEARGGSHGINEEHTRLFEVFAAGETEAAVDLLSTHIHRTLDVEPLLPETP